MTTNIRNRIGNKVAAVLASAVIAASLLVATPLVTSAGAACDGDWDGSNAVDLSDVYAAMHQFGKNGVGVQDVVHMINVTRDNFGARC